MNCRIVRLSLLLAMVGGWAAVAQVPDGPQPMRPPLPGPGPVDAAPVAPAVEAPQGVSGTARDPFWPVGYVPRPIFKPAPGAPGAAAGPALAPATAAVARPADWDEARRRLEIKGVSRIGRDRSTGRDRYFADVNGRAVEDGDVVSVTWDGRVYRWRITHISPTGLQLIKLDSRAE
jgi:hypothetical protein